MPALEQQFISEDKIITPLVEVLSSASPTALTNSNNLPDEPSKSLVDSLDVLFPEQQHEEKKLKQSKELLGGLAHEYNDVELKIVMSEIQYLAETWLDDFERITFKGLTLKELLHERTNV